MSDEELDNIAGGNIRETFEDAFELYRRGLLTGEQAMKVEPACELLHKMGYAGYQGTVDFTNANVYTDKNGNVITRKQFWKNFDAENGTKIIR